MTSFIPSLHPSILLVVPALFFTVGCPRSKGQSSTYTVNATTLDSYDGTHPRLLLDTSTINGIKTNIANPPTGSRWGTIWSSVKSNADLLATSFPSAYIAPVGTSDEQLYQRNTGTGIPEFALAYLLTKTVQPSDDTQWFEAEDAVLLSPMVRLTNAAADGGFVIGTAAGGAVNNNTATPSAVYNVSTLRTAYYHVWARVYAPNANANAFWFSLDVNAPVSVSTPAYGSWIWVNCGSTSLTPGMHQMKVTYEKTGLLIDNFVITPNYNLVPSGLGTEQHRLDAADFTINNSATLVVNTTDALATDGAYLAAPSTVASRTAAPAAGTAGDAQQTVSVNGGVYDVWVRFKGPAATSNAFYFALDHGAYSAVTLNSGSSTVDWIWQKAASGMSLTAGSHVLNVSNDTTGCEVDRFFVAATGTAGPVDPNKYLVAALRWALTSCSYPTWGTGAYGDSDLAAAGQLVGLGLFYDWCYGDLGLGDLQEVGGILNTRGAMMYQAATGDTSGGVTTAWWRNDWLQNHSWSDYNGLTFAGLAIHGDAGMPETLPWLQTALNGIGNTMNDLGPDGADHEGPSYWGSIEDLLRYLDVSKKELGVDFTNTPWLTQTGNYRLYFNTAANVIDASGPMVNFADSVTYEWSGPDYQLRKLASLYNQPSVQWLAGKFDDNKQNGADINPASGGNPWLNLLWYNSAVAETSPAAAGLPCFMHFPDLDFTISRSNWSGNEAVVGFQCGPFQGHQVLANDKPFVNWGSGHEHPAANNFCFYDYGDWQIMNAGYTYKQSAYDNTLLVGGQGQVGESTLTFNGNAAAVTEDPNGVLNPAIDTTLSFSTPPFDYLVGQASAAYPTSDHVTSYKRHLLYLKPDVLVVVDDATLSQANTLQLNFYPWQRNGVEPTHTVVSTNEYLFTGNASLTDFKMLTAPTNLSYTETTTDNSEGQPYNRWVFSLASSGSVTGMSTAVAVTSAPKATGSQKQVPPPTVTYLADADGTAWKFKVGTETMVLDRNTTANYLDEKARLVTCVEAESVTPSSPMFIYTDEPDAEGGQYIAAAPNTVTNSPDTLPTPNVQYMLQTPAAGTYTLWARIKAADGNSHSFWYALNPTGTGAYTNICDTQTFGSWQWVKMTSVSFSTAASTNVLAVKYRQAGCKIDQFILTDDSSYVPAGKY